MATRDPIEEQLQYLQVIDKDYREKINKEERILLDLNDRYIAIQ